MDVTILEARARIGGRVWTLHDPDLAVPIEQGAEFLHGDATETREVARDASLGVIDIAGQRFNATRHRLHRFDDFEERFNRVMKRLDEGRQPDRSFADAIARMPGISQADRRLAVWFVEGYHGADPSRLSARSLAGGDDDPRQMRIARVIGGYDGVVRELASSVVRSIRLGHVVQRIRWSAGEVVVESVSPSGGTLPAISARAVIVTAPLGVLNAPPGASARIEFDPPLESKHRAVRMLAMGHAVRVTLRLDEPIWMSKRFASRHGEGRFDTMAFVFAKSPAVFPTWWTRYPLEAPVLTGWCGGPAAWALSQEPRDSIVDSATRSLATLFGMTRPAIARHIRATFMHDWNTDPYSRGAYSYVQVGGSDAATVLARPVQKTVFHAGEHVSSGRNGTVDGAIASGLRAAEQVLRLKSRR